MSLVSDERVQELLMKEAFLEKLLPRLREEIIEECARMAESYQGPRSIPGAIRALKDKT